MQHSSPFEQIKSVERILHTMLSSWDIPSLPRNQQKLIQELRLSLSDARLDVRDYVYADTRQRQLEFLRSARDRLAGTVSLLLLLGPLIGPADIAQIHAKIDGVLTGLE